MQLGYFLNTKELKLKFNKDGLATLVEILKHIQAQVVILDVDFNPQQRRAIQMEVALMDQLISRLEQKLVVIRKQQESKLKISHAEALTLAQVLKRSGVFQMFHDTYQQNIIREVIQAIDPKYS